MLETTTSPPVGVALLADHLDAALAAGEDLLAAKLKPAADVVEDELPEDRLGTFVATVRKYEAALLLRLLQARRRAAAIVTPDPAVRSVLRLVVSNTDSLLALVDDYGERATENAVHGDDLQHYLRQRGLIAEDAAGAGAFETVTVTDTFRVGGVLPLGGLLDVTAAALDLLDRQFDLYKDIDEVEAADAAEKTVAPQPAADEIDAALAEMRSTMVADAAPSVAADAEANGIGDDSEDDEQGPTAGSLRAALEEINRAP